MADNINDIKDKFRLADIVLNDSQLNKFEIVIDFLIDYNQKVNLTAITDREGIIEKHLIDSVLPLKLYDLKETAVCLDIGAGAGFPSVPVMVFRPDLKFTLLDARKKRVEYLNKLLPKCELKAEEVIHGRAEELGKSEKYKRRFDMITARAVSDIGTLLKYVSPMLKSGGIFMAMRGAKAEMNDEIMKTAEKLKLGFEKEIVYSLPDGDGRRLLIFIKK